ncbi:MAG: hypothetical protein N2441_06435 [Rhodocyclaceae bacterium]|nr:hypothetical protein [Rhodocyclaceae bacterium]
MHDAPLPPRTRRLPARRQSWGVGLLAFLSAAAVGAQPLCPDGREPVQEPLAWHARRLDALAEQCQENADFLAWRGLVLLSLGRIFEAADVLERALMLAPQHTQARQAFLRALFYQPEAAARARAARATAEDEATLAPLTALWAGWRLGHGELAIRYGHDDNLNRATRQEWLALTFAGGELRLPLAASSRAQAGSFVQLDLDAHAYRFGENGRAHELHGRFLAREVPQKSEFALTQGDLLYRIRQPLPAGGEWNGLIAASSLAWQGRTLLRSGRLGLRYSPAQAPCQFWTGLDYEARRHPDLAALDHDLFQGSVLWACAADRPWLAQAALAREFAQTRPGGDALRLALRWLGQRPLWRGRLEAEAWLAWRRESEGYSPYLAQNARLATQNGALRLAWRWPLAREWEALLVGEIERQNANIPLFSLSRRALAAGLVWRW